MAIFAVVLLVHGWLIASLPLMQPRPRTPPLALLVRPVRLQRALEAQPHGPQPSPNKAPSTPTPHSPTPRAPRSGPAYTPTTTPVASSAAPRTATDNIANTPVNPSATAPSASSIDTSKPAAAPTATVGGGPSAQPAASPTAMLDADRAEPPSSTASYLQNPPPEYPPISRRLGEQGRVVVEVLIGRDGQAKQAQIQASSAYPRLDQAALRTVLSWRYQPGRRAGVALDMWFEVPIVFQLNESR